MRFGHDMHRHFVPEWSQHYIDYNRLRCLLKLSKLSEAYRHLDAGITRLDEFLRPCLDRLSAADTALDSEKLRWFKEINNRAVRRILAKLVRHEQAENTSYKRLEARWQKLQSFWEAELVSARQTRARLSLTEKSILSFGLATAEAILSTDNDGFTPLHLAIIGNQTEAALGMIDTLLDANGVVPDVGIMRDVLDIALRTQKDDIVRRLLSGGCAYLCRRSGRGEIALHVAVQVGRMDYVTLIVREMREQSVTLDVPDDSRAWTPLFIACADGNIGIADLLIAEGSSQKQKDRLGWTAKEVAAYRGHLAVAYLFEASTDINASTAGANGPAKTPPYSKVSARTVRCGHDQSVVIATLGTTRIDQPDAGLDLSFCSSACVPGRYDAACFVLEVSVPGVSERRRVPLPILEDQINDPFVFIVPRTGDPCLVFDVVYLAGASGKKMLVASGTAVLASDHQRFGTYRQSLVREQTVSILEKSTMRMKGVVTFTPLVVRPFSHLQIPRLPNDLNRKSSGPPLLVGHRGAGQNVKTRSHLQIGENTIASFLSAVSLGASFVEFDVQITRDLQVIAFHDFSLSESGTDVPIHDVTLDQFLYANNVQSPHRNPLPELGAKHSREKAGRPRSLSLGCQFEAGAVQIRDRMKHTVDFETKGFKPNTRGDFVQDSFATLRDILLKLPQDVGCDIEIKYPRLHESVEAGVAPIAIELNKFVDAVLEELHHNAGRRPVILSSFTPEICILLAIKQRSYPVLFITNAGKLPMSDMEVRAADLQRAVHFAERWGLAGVVFACESLLLCPRLVSLVKTRGLVCGTYGPPNNEPDNVKVQADAGVDLIVADRVGLIAHSLAG